MKAKNAPATTAGTPTLAEAFTYNENGDDLEKAIRASAFLLKWSAEGGNDEVDGYLAFGIAVALEKCAGLVKRLFTRDDIEKLGADPQQVRAARSE
jgi:hypothetical protein